MVTGFLDERETDILWVELVGGGMESSVRGFFAEGYGSLSFLHRQ
jgi:hypothetical protein